MRDVSADDISGLVAELCVRASRRPIAGVVDALRACRDAEGGALAKGTLADLVANAEAAAEDDVPLCQDTGAFVVLIDWGQDAHLVGGDLQEAVDAGVRKATEEAYLRRSIVGDPIRRANTGDNTPAFVHVHMAGGEGVRIRVALKGAGSENCSALRMLAPGEGLPGARDVVLEAVRTAGGKCCPPGIVGVGLGGTFDLCAHLAKRAAVRPLQRHNPDPFYAELERQWLADVNALGVGPGGLGGETTALALNIEVAPCHIASLPVAVNINCHATRAEEGEL